MGIYSGYNDRNNVMLMNEMSEEAILEAYFGISKELEDIIIQLGVFRSKYTDRFKYGMYFDDVNIDPELLKFNRMMEDFFGFGTFSMIVDPGVVQNAYTIAIGTRIDTNTRRDIRADKNGFKYDKSAGYVCVTYIYTGLIFNDDYTDKEIMAIIMHEVGHNFSGTMDNIVSITEFIQKLLFLPTIILGIIVGILNLDPAMGVRISATALNSTSEAYVNFMREARKNETAFASIAKFSKAITAPAKDALFNVFSIITPFQLLEPGRLSAAITYKLTKFMKDPTNLLHLVSGYRNEKISDNFATMYGLGPDLTSALSKMDAQDGGIATQHLVRSVPLLGHLYDMIMIPYVAVCSLLDPHPSTPERLRNQLMILKAEVGKEKLDPKLKKAIQDDIDDIERQIMDAKKEFSVFDGKAISKLYGFILYNVFKGDFREVFANPEKNAKEYDAAYEKALNKSKK